VLVAFAGTLGAAFFATSSGCTDAQPTPASSAPIEPTVDVPPPPPPVEAAARDAAIYDPMPERPSFVPEGWELWTDYRKSCNIYTPRRREVVPPDATWRACRSDFRPPNDSGPPACQEWDVVEPGQLRAGANSGYSASALNDGKVQVQQLRVFEKYATWVVVDLLTGRSTNAVLIADFGTCYPHPSLPSATASVYSVVKPADVGRFDAKVGYLVLPHEPTTPTAGGVYVPSSSLEIGRTLVGSTEVAGVFTGPFSNPRAAGLRLSSDPRLQPLLRFFRGDTAYIESYDGNHYVWQVAAPGAAVETWFDNGNDQSVGDHGLTTDGQTVAWVHSQGCRDVSCSQASLMVAPYPAPGSKPSGRRLHSERPTTSDLVLGCGYIATTGGYADYRTFLRVTRIADGVSWMIRNEDNPKFNFNVPLAVTCEHVYFIRSNPESAEFNVVKMRLDALGPEIAPD
jgi:hypothetical protein